MSDSLRSENCFIGICLVVAYVGKSVAWMVEASSEPDFRRN